MVLLDTICPPDDEAGKTNKRFCLTDAKSRPRFVRHKQYLQWRNETHFEIV